MCHTKINSISKIYYYLIKIKTVLANFGSEKQFKVKKKAYFITTAIDVLGEK